MTAGVSQVKQKSHKKKKREIDKPPMATTTPSGIRGLMCLSYGFRYCCNALATLVVERTQCSSLYVTSAHAANCSALPAVGTISAVSKMYACSQVI